MDLVIDKAPDTGELHLDIDSPTLDRGPPILNVGTQLTEAAAPTLNLGTLAAADVVHDIGSPILNGGTQLTEVDAPALKVGKLAAAAAAGVVHGKGLIFLGSTLGAEWVDTGEFKEASVSITADVGVAEPLGGV